MPLSALIYFYRRRLRTHPWQELLAGLGIAIGVALVLAVQVANSSIASASDQVVKSIVGSADFQLRARSQDGTDERLVERVRALSGVRAAASLLQLTAAVRGPSGRELTVQLASADVSLGAVNPLAAGVPLERLAARTVLLPLATARALGVSPQPATGIPKAPPVVSLLVRGRAVPVRVGAVLGAETVGALASARAVLAPLSSVQKLAQLPGRITGVLVQADPSARDAVHRELEHLAGGRLTLAPATEDAQLLRQATGPNADATGFFALVSGLVGLLLAFNAMLLSAPERRRLVADLRIQGTRTRDLVKLLMFQALCLGLFASLVGVLLGDLLSRVAFRQTPGYLAAAFPLGTQTVVGWQPVMLSVLGGVIAACLAASPPLLDLRRSRAVDAVYFEAGEPGQAVSDRARLGLFAGSIALIGASVAIVLVFDPSATVVSIIAVAFAAVLAIPLGFTAVVSLAQLLAATTPALNVLLVATRALRATTTRSLALAATGAVAVFGTVAVEGAHRDLLGGLYTDYASYVSTADLWVTIPRDELATSSFPARAIPAQVASLPGVARVRAYQGGFFDLLGRRVWVIARSPGARSMIPRGQVLSGGSALAEARLRQGGWVAASGQLARAVGARPGGLLTLPTPSGPVSYHLAATTSNLGWTAGAIVLNDADYRRAWATADPTALEVDLAPGWSAPAVKRALEALLGAGSGLRVQTSAARSAQADGLAREGLSRLTQIALLLTIAAALAMAAAMGAAILQRRASLASLRLQGFRPAQLQLVLLCESALVLLTGSLTGALSGLYGQALIDRYLRLVSGFPAPFSAAAPQLLATVAAVTGAALIALVVPGVFASRAPARLALQE
jgi:putative ABC transport system permease protein